MSSNAKTAPTADASVEHQIRSLAEKRHLPAPHLEQWLGLDAPSSARFLEIAQKLRLRTGQLLGALDMLSEIAVRERADVAAILSKPSVARIVDGAGSAPERAHQFIEEVRALRYPRLRNAADRIRTEAAAIRLSRGARLVLPKELGSDELTIELKVRTVAELEKFISALGEKRAAIARIIAMLGGSDDV
ncbi:MAG TPA: hypothetical protein VEF07_10425 [Candidatus Binataceae bacterium]|nr:hypothetical protein [Candidatus Binataceae bacterium]